MASSLAGERQGNVGPMISSWWWASLGIAGLGALVLGVVDRALKAEAVAIDSAAAAVDRARSTIDNS